MNEMLKKRPKDPIAESTYTEKYSTPKAHSASQPPQSAPVQADKGFDGIEAIAFLI